jgi:hypothetical protein
MELNATSRFSKHVWVEEDISKFVAWYLEYFGENK